jgi:hypothetical protein
MLNLTKTINELPFPSDCILEKKVGSKFEEFHRSLYYNIWKDEPEDLTQPIYRGYNFNRNSPESVSGAFLSSLASQLELRSLGISKAKRKVLLCNGVLTEVSFCRHSSISGKYNKVCLVFGRIRDAYSFANTAELEKRSVGAGTYVEKVTVPLNYGGTVLKGADAPSRAVLSRDMLNSFEFAGLPMYTFFSSIIGPLMNHNNSSWLFKLKFNPFQRVLRKEDNYALYAAGGAFEGGSIQSQDIYLKVSVFENEEAEKCLSIGFVYSFADCMKTTGYLVQREGDRNVFFSMESEPEKIGELNFVNGYGSLMDMFNWLMLDNGSTWGVENLIKCSFDGRHQTTFISPDTLDAKIAHKKMVANQTLGMSQYAQAVTNTMIPNGSVVGIKKSNSETSVGYFFTVRSWSGAAYKAIITGEKIPINSSGRFVPLEIASARTMDSLLKKVFSKIDKGTLTVVYAHTHCSAQGGTHLRTSDIDVLWTRGDTEYTDDQLQRLNGPGSRMIASRRMRTFRNNHGIGGTNTVEITKELYGTIFDGMVIRPLPLIPLASIDAFLKYGVGMIKRNGYFDIVDTNGHYPYLYNYFVLCNKRHKINYSPKLLTCDPEVAIRFTKSQTFEGGARLVLSVESALEKVPEGFNCATIDPCTAAKIYLSKGDNDMPIRESEIASGDPKTKISLTIEEGILNEKKSTWS